MTVDLIYCFRDAENDDAINNIIKDLVTIKFLYNKFQLVKESV